MYDLKTFQINNLTVDYSGINPVHLPEGFAEDLLVEVEGTLDAAGGEMTCNMRLNSGMRSVKRIPIRSKCSVSSRMLNRLRGSLWAIKWCKSMQTPNSWTGMQTDILPGAKLEAEGYLEDGILFADEVEFWGPDQIEVEGLVTDS